MCSIVWLWGNSERSDACSKAQFDLKKWSTLIFGKSNQIFNVRRVPFVDCDEKKFVNFSLLLAKVAHFSSGVLECESKPWLFW